MRSFATFLIAAALASFSSAAPVIAKAGVSVPGPVSGVVPSVGQVNPLKGVDVRDVKSDITGVVKSVESKVSDLHLRAATPSVDDIFSGLSAEIAPYVELLTYLTPSNCTVSQITSIVTSIKTPIVAAVPQLQGLVGQQASTIMAAANAASGDAQLTVSQVADSVGSLLTPIITGVENVVDVSESQGGIVVTDVKTLVGDLNTAVSDIVSAVVDLVPDLSSALAQVLQPVDGLVSEIGLNLTILGITL